MDFMDSNSSLNWVKKKEKNLALDISDSAYKAAI